MNGPSTRAASCRPDDAVLEIRQSAPGADPRSFRSGRAARMGCVASARAGSLIRECVIRNGVGTRRAPLVPSGSRPARSIRSTALLPVISASAWMLVTSTLSARQIAGDRVSAGRGVRYDGNRLECCVPGRVDDQVGRGDLRRQARIDRQRRLARAQQRVDRAPTTAAVDVDALRSGQRPVDQVDLADRGSGAPRRRSPPRSPAAGRPRRWRRARRWCRR